MSEKSKEEILMEVFQTDANDIDALRLSIVLNPSLELIKQAMEAFHQSKSVSESLPPTDEEIENEIQERVLSTYQGINFLEGAKWMRDQWMKGKKVIIEIK